MIPKYQENFSKNVGCVSWKGRQLVDPEELSTFLHGPVFSRLTDSETKKELEGDLHALATTGMATDTLAKLLRSNNGNKEPWEVGEALAECMLEEELGVKWPWNTERDKRTPKASLPGADLIGFINISDENLLLLGEVKTSSDGDAPPKVMTGRSGMIHQLDTLCSKMDIQFCLIGWLHVRCKNTPLWTIFQDSVSRYLASGGQALALFGILLRDTKPNKFDLENRGIALTKIPNPPKCTQLHAWYMPFPQGTWWTICQGGKI
jgi:hypothetical protein